jgi:hypothetical protein
MQTRIRAEQRRRENKQIRTDSALANEAPDSALANEAPDSALANEAPFRPANRNTRRRHAQRRKAQADWDARQAKQDTADEQADSALPTNAEEPEHQSYRPPGANMGRSMTRREKAQANRDA